MMARIMTGGLDPAIGGQTFSLETDNPGGGLKFLEMEIPG